MNEKIEDDYVYDIAFSFAGEQRDYVYEVYRILTEEYNVKVFYDKDKEIEIKNWGGDLGEIFQQVYEKQSKWCLMFISKDYKDKFWAIHEKRSALSRAIRDKGVYLLPARFDDTEIEGIPKTTAYIDISKKTPRDFSEFVIGKLEIPLKQKDIDSNLPDIKVKVNYVAFVGESVAFHVLCINVSNHGNYPVFLKYPRIELKNGLHLPIRKDDFYGNTISEIGKLEPGDSFEIMSNPANYANYMNELDFVMVYDKIGRKFKSSSEELNKAVNNLNEGIISYNKSVSE
jgi:hypothetical protein